MEKTVRPATPVEKPETNKAKSPIPALLTALNTAYPPYSPLRLQLTNSILSAEYRQLTLPTKQNNPYNLYSSCCMP